MAEIIPNLITHLNNNATAYAFFANRITGDDVPDGQVYPYAYLWEVSSPQQYTHQGVSGRTALIQCDVMSDSISEVDEGKRVIKTALSGYKGQMGSMSVGYCFVNVRSVPKDAEQKAYRRILEIEIATND